MRCNLKCTGCYAESYKKEEDLEFETLDRIITEAKKWEQRYLLFWVENLF